MAPSPRRLPSAERAIVDATKITEYLLNASHPDNGGKARFFESLGFSAAAPMLLAAALGGQATSGEVVQESMSTHGTKYVVDGQLEAPDGRRRAVRTVWIIDAGQELPRLVTAYPRGSDDMDAIKEHARVVLTKPLPKDRLEAGDVGTVVHVYKDELAYEVEFTTLDGGTAAVVTVESSDVRPVSRREITHARERAAS